MTVDCTCGFSFQLRGHLWVVIAELSGQPESVVIVNLTSRRPDSDTTVILKAGDHRFIKHETVVNYTDARKFSKDDLISRIEQKFFKVDDVFSKDNLKTMQQGLLDSPYTPRDIKKSCAKVI